MCFGKNDVNYSIYGGTAPYAYTVIVGLILKENEKINSFQLNGTNVTTGLPAGDYAYHVVDANSCTASGSFTITEPDSNLNIILYYLLVKV